VWDVPPVADSEIQNPKSKIQTADLLANLAEAVIGKRVNVQGALESVSSAVLPQIQQRMAELPRQADFARWLEWFFADRSTRTISPYSFVTLPQYTQRLGDQADFLAWHEALLLSPVDGWNFSRLAEGWLRRAKQGDSGADSYAEWTSGQAIRFAPWGG